VKRALGIIEVTSWTVSMAVLDCMEKAATIELLQIELNDFYGTCMKVAGTPADVRAAVLAGKALAEAMHATCAATVINAPDERARPGYYAPPEFTPLMESNLVHFPRKPSPPAPLPTGEGSIEEEETDMTEQAPFAIGLIETQGFTAVIEAIDTACKAANVEVIGREKLGGGYITVLIKGDVAAVNAAVQAGIAKVDGLGKLIAGHVIPRPSHAVLSLLPKVQ
jgi:carbon dioxide concentrating mechanism protein CcmO